MSAYTQKMRLGSSGMVTVVCALLFVAAQARAACINRFTHHDRGAEHVVTLLTGKLTFQDAQALSAAIREGKSAPIEWVQADGKTISKQFGELKIVRPMPVACDGNPSGVVIIATFGTLQVPSKKIYIKFGPDNIVAFDEQVD